VDTETDSASVSFRASGFGLTSTEAPHEGQTPSPAAVTRGHLWPSPWSALAGGLWRMAASGWCPRGRMDQRPCDEIPCSLLNKAENFNMDSSRSCKLTEPLLIVAMFNCYNFYIYVHLIFQAVIIYS
jgi:hypothetical protein